MVECYCPVHVGAFLLIVTGSLHHVLRVTEQSQVYQLVIQIILLYRHIFESRCKCVFFAVINDDFFFFFFSCSHLTKPNGIVVSLSSSVEVDSLFDVIMALIVPGQMVGSCPVPCVIGYFRCLTSQQNTTLTNVKLSLLLGMIIHVILHCPTLLFQMQTLLSFQLNFN